MKDASVNSAAETQISVGDRVRVLSTTTHLNRFIPQMIGKVCVVVEVCPLGCLCIADPDDSKHPNGWLFSAGEYEWVCSGRTEQAVTLLQWRAKVGTQPEGVVILDRSKRIDEGRPTRIKRPGNGQPWQHVQIDRVNHAERFLHLSLL